MDSIKGNKKKGNNLGRTNQKRLATTETTTKRDRKNSNIYS